MARVVMEGWRRASSRVKRMFASLLWLVGGGFINLGDFFGEVTGCCDDFEDEGEKGIKRDQKEVSDDEG